AGRLPVPAPPRRPAAGEADVVRNLEQPRGLLLRHDAAPNAAERVQERALHRILGLLARAELVQAVAEDLVRVLLVQRTGQIGLVGGWPGEPTRAAYGRYDC